MIQFITAVVILAIVMAIVQFLHHKRRIKDSIVRLNCRFCLSENSDELLDTYKRETNITIDGILGNDFMVDHDYIIDYENLVVKHKSVRISIKDSMDIVEIPLIILYQDVRKYIFMLDTGATASIIHSRCLKDGLIHNIEDEDCEIFGFGGKGSSSKAVSACFYYSKKRQNTKK